jgi:hypothetical protein
MPHLTVDDGEPLLVEGELMQTGALLHFIAARADSLVHIPFDELWEDFSRTFRQLDIRQVTSLEYAFARIESVAALSPIADEWERIFTAVQQPIALERDAELATAEPRLKIRLAEAAILFGGPAGMDYLPRYLELDQDSRTALGILGDPEWYHNLLANPPDQRQTAAVSGGPDESP